MEGASNIFVLGLDDENEELLNRLPGAADLRFHRLLAPGEVRLELMDKARTRLNAFNGRVDAIVGFHDFPASAMVAMLCEERGLPGVPPEAVIKCEHKYWSRLEQAKAIDELPRFGAVDLASPSVPDDLKYPMWLKPVMASSRSLRVDNEEGLARAAAAMRARVAEVRLDLPPEVRGVAWLAEEALTGVQASTEGYVYRGQVTVYGAVDRIDYPGSPSVLRHQYPSQLADDTVRRMNEVSELVMRQIGFDNGTFGVDFFCHPESGQVCLLDIKARHSPSLARVFELVDGVSNHDSMVKLGLGHDPGVRRRRGEYQIAGRCVLRRFDDGVASRVPTREEVMNLEYGLPGVEVTVVPARGQRLSDLPSQGGFELARVFVAAQTERELIHKYRRCVESLRFEFDAAVTSKSA